MAGGRSERSGRAWWGIAGAGLLGLALRLAHLSELQGTPLLATLMGDASQYDAWARQIAAGQWLGTEVFYQSPLYPYALAVVYAVAGHDLELVRLIQALLGAASCVLLGVAGRRFFSNRVGIVSALLMAACPSAIFFDGLIQKSSLDIFLVTLLLALAATASARVGWKWLAALGAAAGAFALNRENGRVLLLVFAAWGWFRFRDRPVRQRAAGLAVFAAGVLAILLPVGLRNYEVGGEFLVSTSQLGPNFYIGNNPGASGSYEPLVPGRGDPVYEREDATRLASEASGRALTSGEVSNYWVGRSVSYIRSEPWHWVTLLGKKALLTVNAGELPDTESMAVYTDYSRVLMALGWLDLGLLLPLAAFGAWVHRAEWRRLLVLYGIFASLAVSVALFYVVDRYRHPFLPIVLLFAAAGLCGLYELNPFRRRAPAAGTRAAGGKRRRSAASAPSPVARPRWVPGVAGAGLVAIVVNLPMKVVHDETYLNLGVALARNGRPADAIPMLSRAAAREPENAEPRFRLGLAYQDAGDAAPAIDALTNAVRLRPGHADAHAALALLLRAGSDPGAALEHFREAARLAPGSAANHSNLGLALMEAGQPFEAVAAHRRAVALSPGDAARHNNLAMALQQAGNVTEALREYERAITLDPGHVEAHVNLALALAAQASTGAAKPGEALARLEIALRLARAGGYPDAARAIEDAIRELPTTPRAAPPSPRPAGPRK